MTMEKNRVELKGSARTALPGGKDIGPADPNQQLEVSVLLRRGSSPEKFPPAAKMGTELPRQRKYLTREEFARTHGAAEADVEKIRAFAAAHGLQVVAEDRGRRMVKLGGTVRAMNEAFGVTLHRYEHGSGAYRGRTGALTIPADLEAVVQGVFGLDNRPQAKAHFRLRKKNLAFTPRPRRSLTRHCKSQKLMNFPRG